MGTKKSDIIDSIYAILAYQAEGIPLIEVAEKVYDYVESTKVIPKEVWEAQLKENFEKEMESLKDLNETKSAEALR